MPSAPEMPGHRSFWLPPPWPRPGGEAILPEEETRHAVRVLRVKPGERVRLVDGEGRQAEAVAVAVQGSHLRVRLEEIGASPFDDMLLGRLGLPWMRSAGRLDWAIEKGTELGASTLEIYVADRSVRRGAQEPELKGSRGKVEARARAKMDRWIRVARAAMKQSGRARLPAVRIHASLDDLLDASGESRILVADPGGGGLSKEALGSHEGRLLLVGPEGGFSPREEAVISARQPARLSLGPRRLRVETAGVALCALVAVTLAAAADTWAARTWKGTS